MEEEIKKIVNLAEVLVKTKTGDSFSEIQKIVLWESLSDSTKTYDQIAQDYYYAPSYIKRFVAPRLWNLLSEALETKVNRANCRRLFLQAIADYPALPILLESPQGVVPLTSNFYVERPPVEEICYQEILKTSALIRIKAPQKMGKTSLILRMMEQGKIYHYHCVYLTLNLADSELFSSGRKFFRWFCANIVKQLAIESQLDNYWDDDLGYLMSCTFYFQSYLIPALNAPIILVLDEVNRLFDYPKLAGDFFSMLRSWHEESKNFGVWQKLRLVLSHSTEIYVKLDAKRSPFNVGLAIELPPFNSLQVLELSQRHGLNLSSQQLSQIMELLGGFPSLVRQLFYEMGCCHFSWEVLMETVTTDKGIFHREMQAKCDYLQQNLDLTVVYQQLLNNQNAIQLEREQLFKLKSLGLIYGNGKLARVSCDLYRQYFKNYL
jgi:hypothetical protein